MEDIANYVLFNCYFSSWYMLKHNHSKGSKNFKMWIDNFFFIFSVKIHCKMSKFILLVCILLLTTNIVSAASKCGRHGDSVSIASLFLHITKFNNFIQIDNNNNNNHVPINRNKNIYIFIYIFSTLDKNTKGYMKKTFKIFNQWIQKNHFLDETFTFNDHGTKRVKNVSKIFDVSGKRVTESSRRKNNNRVMRICPVNWSLVNIESLK